MKDLLEICCGLDVHKDKIVACILSGPIGKTAVSEIRDFPTFVSGLIDLRDWILSCGCQHIAMESIGIYRVALYEVLEDSPAGLTLLVVNARHMKNVPGKKGYARRGVDRHPPACWSPQCNFIPKKTVRSYVILPVTA